MVIKKNMNKLLLTMIMCFFVVPAYGMKSIWGPPPQDKRDPDAAHYQYIPLPESALAQTWNAARVAAHPQAPPPAPARDLLALNQAAYTLASLFDHAHAIKPKLPGYANAYNAASQALPVIEQLVIKRYGSSMIITSDVLQTACLPEALPIIKQSLFQLVTAQPGTTSPQDVEKHSGILNRALILLFSLPSLPHLHVPRS